MVKPLSFNLRVLTAELVGCPKIKELYGILCNLVSETGEACQGEDSV